MTSPSPDDSRAGADSAPPEHPKPGRYRHFKGGEYRVVDSARHSETGEWLVIYRPLYGDGGLWARPLAMFMETVEVDGRPLARFSRIGD